MTPTHKVVAGLLVALLVFGICFGAYLHGKSEAAADAQIKALQSQITTLTAQQTQVQQQTQTQVQAIQTQASAAKTPAQTIVYVNKTDPALNAVAQPTPAPNPALPDAPTPQPTAVVDLAALKAEVTAAATCQVSLTGCQKELADSAQVVKESQQELATVKATKSTKFMTKTKWAVIGAAAGIVIGFLAHR
jgi:hypothetical protein